MIIETLKKSLGDEVALSPGRQDSATPDVIDKNECTKRIVVPEKFRADVEALQVYAQSPLITGLCITISLGELLSICPRQRKRSDAYNGLIRFLKEELDTELILKSQKTNKYDE